MMDNAELNRLLLANRSCGLCPMRGKTFVGADSWNGQALPVSVLFLGLNPGVEEAKAGLPFVGPSGRFLRKAIALAPYPVTWAMTNSILCSTANETGIPDPNACRACCKGNVGKIWEVFRPEVIVPCGNGAAAMFEIREGITRAEKLWYISRGRNKKGYPTVVAPLQHPSALIRSGGQASPKYPNWQARINDIFRIGNLLNGEDPGTVLEKSGISWRGLYGLESASGRDPGPI